MLVTVHQIDRGVDTGGIICHGFPTLWHSIQCMISDSVLGHAELVSKIVMEESLGREFCPIPQWSTGRVFKRADLTNEVIEIANRRISEGLIENFAKLGGEENFQTISLRI